MTTPHLPPDFDLTDPDMNRRALPIAELAELRHTAPVWWNAQQDSGPFGDGGHWVVTRHSDVREVSRHSELYSSATHTVLPRYPAGTPRAQLQASGNVMLNMDAPHHTELRKIISRGFTPRAVEALRADLGARARRIVAEAAATELIIYAMGLAADRARDPGPDIITKLIQADVDGHGLTNDEFGFFMVLLAVAGNETTRNSITHGMIAFTEHPDQWELYNRERPATAADEIVRWGTPVSSFQRTAVRDVELSGVRIRAGDRVVMSYRSANFDETVFEDPHTFNILRDPNPHVGFGGTGAHFCIGANLARMTIDLIFNAIADEMPDLRPLGEPERLRSGWLNGIKHWQVDYRPERVAASASAAHAGQPVGAGDTAQDPVA